MQYSLAGPLSKERRWECLASETSILVRSLLDWVKSAWVDIHKIWRYIYLWDCCSSLINDVVPSPSIDQFGEIFEGDKYHSRTVCGTFVHMLSCDILLCMWYVRAMHTCTCFSYRGAWPGAGLVTWGTYMFQWLPHDGRPHQATQK